MPLVWSRTYTISGTIVQRNFTRRYSLLRAGSAGAEFGDCVLPLSPTVQLLMYKSRGTDKSVRHTHTKNAVSSEIWGKIEAMPYILEHLSSLRQEITDLRNMNARFTGKGSDSQIDQSAVEMRANRLAEIKKELSQMLNRPEDPAVWWEKGGRRNRVA